MSIIRSNIARQLLAEGGAPRKGYVTGGDIEDDVAQMPMDRDWETNQVKA